jgi:hypothetical protein
MRSEIRYERGEGKPSSSDSTTSAPESVAAVAAALADASVAGMSSSEELESHRPGTFTWTRYRVVMLPSLEGSRKRKWTQGSKSLCAREETKNRQRVTMVLRISSTIRVATRISRWIRGTWWLM